MNAAEELNEACAYDYLERYDQALTFILRSWETRKPGQERIVWPVVEAPRLKRIWLDMGKTGVVRDEKGMAAIRDRLLTNIAMLEVTTQLMGHTQLGHEELLEQAGRAEMSKEEYEQFGDFLTDASGQWILSDFAIKPLQTLYTPLFRAESAEDQLYAADKILNVVHQRSDLAALFVRGGVNTLNEIARQGGYSPE